MNASLTKGPHHIGLTVSNLEESAKLFTSLLGWKEVRRKEDYPAVFVRIPVSLNNSFHSGIVRYTQKMKNIKNQ